MATKKPKTSKGTKAKSTKPKTATKTAEKSVSEAPKKVEKEEVVVVEKTEKSCLSGFFAKKYEEKESILTIFKNHKFYGALLAEVIGTALLTLILFTTSILGVMYSGVFMAFAFIAVTIAVYAFSGACLNPIFTVGMMATRRMSVIRGVMYIIAEIVGAWLGWLIFNAFHLAGGDTAYAMPAMSTIAENNFWPIAMVEILGAIILGFLYTRALKYKRSVFTFAVVVAGGFALCFILSFIVSAAMLQVQNSYIHNPAVALMLQIFPTSGGDFGEIFGGIMQALSCYAILPMIGGVCGFYLADLTAKLNDEE